MQSTWLDMLDFIGLHGGASNGVSLDEGDYVSGKKVVLHVGGFEL